MSTHRCIGIFTAGLDDEYQANIWHAMEQEASRRGLGTISFIGSRLGSPIASEASSNLAYNLASQHNIDGLIVIASSLATFFSTVDLHQFLSSWSTLPSVSIGMRLEGMSDVTVEGEQGVRTLVEHLLTVHGRRRIAVVKGPVYHQESISRFDTVVRVLEEHGIPLHDSLVLEGMFTEESGRAAVCRLIGQGTEFDALVCLNDWMALGALEELARSGIRVPDDVSVVGFDGLDPARYASPPLTTVTQPLYEMGIIAVDMLDRLMAGGAEEHICLPCAAVIRESCGCNPHVDLTPGLTTLPQHATAAERMATEELVALMAQGDYDAWIARLNRALDASAASNGALHHWQDYLSVIDYQTRDLASSASVKRSTMMAGARTLVGEKLGRFQAAKRVAVQKSFDNLRTVSATLSGTFEAEQLIPNFRQSLQQFDLDEGYLVSFADQPNRARLVMTTHEIDCDEATADSFPLQEILPSCLPSVWRRRRWVLLPLVYLDEPMGYLLVPFGMVAPELYAVLQEQISATWKGSLLQQQIRDHERTLEEQVERRTDDLRTEVKRRIELENEVMEIATKTMERIGQDLHDDLCQYILGISLLATSAHQQLVEEHGIRLAELEQISRHLGHAISKVRTISRGLMPLELSSSSFVQRLEALVGESLRHADVEIDINIDPLFTIGDSTRELNLFRIVQEALTNAIKHSKASHIEVSSTSVQAEDGTISYTLSIRDDGVGLARKPNVRGLGMRIMKNRAAMADALLTVESSSDGTVVAIAFKESHHA